MIASPEAPAAFAEFLRVVVAVSRSARERGELGEGGGPVWSLEEWRQFIDAGQDYAETGGLFAAGVHKTITQVDTMLRDGKDARFIHRALFWLGRQAEREDAEQREKERQRELAIQRRDRERLIQVEEEKELIRIEARERAKARFAGGERPRRRRSESDL